MKNYGKLINPTTLEFERTLPGPIDMVWEYLVDDHKRSLWFAGGTTDLVPNGKMEFVFRNSHYTSEPEPIPDKYKEFEDGHRSYATIVEVKKPNLFVFQWEEGLITIKLEKQSDETVKLTLTHEKLKEDIEYRLGTLAGWHTHLNILVDRLNKNKVKGFWTVHMALEEEYRDRIG